MTEKKNKQLNVKPKVIEHGFRDYFDQIKDFCVLAENETKLVKTKLNMKGTNWENYPESLMYRLYKSKKYDNGNGAAVILYDEDGICGFSGVERHNDEIAMIAKRLYILRKYRTFPFFSTFMIKPQIDWAKRKGFKACLISINEYQRDTILRIFKRAQKRSAIILGREVYPDGNLFNQMRINPVKIFINGEHQYIISYLIDKDYQINYGEL